MSVEFDSAEMLIKQKGFSVGNTSITDPFLRSITCKCESIVVLPFFTFAIHKTMLIALPDEMMTCLERTRKNALIPWEVQKQIQTAI